MASLEKRTVAATETSGLAATGALETGKENFGDDLSEKADDFCFECKRSLIKSRELINVTGQTQRRWHPECFKCMICREPMDKKQSCHVFRDQIVCRNDYLRLKRDQAIKCKRCSWPIEASDWVRRAASYVYHLACFNCDICFRQLNTGEQFVISGQQAANGSGSEPGSCDSIRLLCRHHFTIFDSKLQKTRVNTSTVQPSPASEGFLFAPNGGSAGANQQTLSGRKDGSPEKTGGSCKQKNRHSSFQRQQRQQQQQQQQQQHHHQQQIEHPNPLAASSTLAFSSINAGPLTISPNSPSQLQSIDRNQERSPPTAGKDLSLATELSSLSSSSLSPSASSSSANETSSALGLVVDESPFGQQAANCGPPSGSAASSSITNSIGCTTGGRPLTPTSSCGNVGGGGGIGSGLQSKSKRVRTTFTEDQLSILQTHFQIDSNPDGQDLERIATITGLSKRVTQVWFQNSRARQKKYMIKRKPSHGTVTAINLASLSGGQLQVQHLHQDGDEELRNQQNHHLTAHQHQQSIHHQISHNQQTISMAKSSGSSNGLVSSSISSHEELKSNAHNSNGFLDQNQATFVLKNCDYRENSPFASEDSLNHQRVQLSNSRQTMIVSNEDCRTGQKEEALFVEDCDEEELSDGDSSTDVEAIH